MNYIEEYTIDNAWRSVMWMCLKNGYDYRVEQGSYIGQIRKQLPYVMIRIKNPYKRPLAPIMPPNIPPPTTDEKIDQYFVEYLMNPVLEKKEQYRYSTYIVPQIDIVINKLYKSNGNTNQATITIGDENSIKLSDPPCLRVIDFKVVNGYLNMSVFFRSWDLISGLLVNLGGLQLLKEYVLDYVNFKLDINKKSEFKDGEIIAYSNGLHIYEQYFDLVKRLNIVE